MQMDTEILFYTAIGLILILNVVSIYMRIRSTFAIAEYEKALKEEAAAGNTATDNKKDR